jgi:hypothetical protein
MQNEIYEILKIAKISMLSEILVLGLFFLSMGHCDGVEDARTRLRSATSALNCTHRDIPKFVDDNVKNGGCSAFWSCQQDLVRGFNLSAGNGCNIVGANLTLVFSFLTVSPSNNLNLTSIDFTTRDVAGVALRLPRGLDLGKGLRQCSIWTEDQFAAAPANGPDAPCCEVAPYMSPCVDHFMHLYTKYTGLASCQLCVRASGTAPVPATCNDGVSNGNESGIDCGSSSGCPTRDCCANGYLDQGERGIDCGDDCDDCFDSGSTCQNNDFCCESTNTSRKATPCRGSYSPRCVDMRCQQGCTTFFSGWKADNSCRPLAPTGICQLDSVSTCFTSSGLTFDRCIAVAQPDASKVFATCDAACRRPNSCNGTIGSPPNITSLCFTSGQNGCPAGLACDAFGRCQQPAACGSVCGEPDTVFGGCKGTCKSFPCISETSCNCANKIATGNSDGLCFKYKNGAQSRCDTRDVCDCTENEKEVYLECDASCNKNVTCMPLQLISSWTAARLCKVNNEPCRMDNNRMGVCGSAGKCVALTTTDVGATTSTGGSSGSGSTASAIDSTAIDSTTIDPSLSMTSESLTSNSDSTSSSQVMETTVVDKDAGSPTSDSLPIIIGAVAGGCFLLMLLLLVFAVMWRRRTRANDDDSLPSSGPETSSVAPSIGEYGAISQLPPPSGVYGSAPLIAGSDGSSSDPVDARPGDTKMTKAPVIYDRAL